MQDSFAPPDILGIKCISLLLETLLINPDLFISPSTTIDIFGLIRSPNKRPAFIPGCKESKLSITDFSEEPGMQILFCPSVCFCKFDGICTKGMVLTV